MTQAICVPAQWSADLHTTFGDPFQEAGEIRNTEAKRQKHTAQKHVCWFIKMPGMVATGAWRYGDTGDFIAKPENSVIPCLIRGNYGAESYRT